MTAEILLADSNESVVQALGDYLEELGFTVHRALDGATALHTLNTNRLRLIIIAMNLTNPSCEEVFKAAHQKDPTSEVVIMTSEEDGQKASELVREGAFDFLLKPFNERALERIVRAAIRKQDAIYAKERLVKQLMSKTKRLEALVVEQEKRVAELESSRRNAEDTFSRNQELQQEVEKLERLIEQKEEALHRANELVETQKVEKAPNTPFVEDTNTVASPSRVLKFLEYLFLTCAFGFLILGIMGMTLLPNTGGFAAGKSVLVRHAFLVAVLFLGGTVLVRLHAMSSYFQLRATDDEKPSYWERILIHAMRIATILVVVLGSCAALQFHSALTSPAASHLSNGQSALTLYLQSSVHRELAALALTGAVILLLSATIAETLLVRINFSKTLKLHAQKSSAQQRLKTL